RVLPQLHARAGAAGRSAGVPAPATRRRGESQRERRRRAAIGVHGEPVYRTIAVRNARPAAWRSVLESVPMRDRIRRLSSVNTLQRNTEARGSPAAVRLRIGTSDGQRGLRASVIMASTEHWWSA